MKKEVGISCLSWLLYYFTLCNLSWIYSCKGAAIARVPRFLKKISNRFQETWFLQKLVYIRKIMRSTLPYFHNFSDKWWKKLKLDYLSALPMKVLECLLVYSTKNIFRQCESFHVFLSSLNHWTFYHNVYM